jgi:hypothetical protein
MELIVWIFGVLLLLFFFLLAIVNYELASRIEGLKDASKRLRNDLEVFVSDVNTHVRITSQRLHELEQKIIATDLSLNDLVVNTQNKTKQLEERIIKLEKTSKEFDWCLKDTIQYTVKLERRIIALEQHKQSEIRANYNMDFTHINTDI